MGVFYKVFLMIYIIIYILIMFIYNINAFRKTYDIDPRVVTKNDKVMYKFERYRDLIFVFVFVNIIVFCIFPKVYFILVPITYLELEILKMTGIFLLIVSLILTRVSQIQLREAWRIGIDRSETKGILITTGIYSRSRNPIALGMLLGIIGLFLVIPNITTFAMIFLVHLIFSVRILLEEEHLLNLHGEEYKKYLRRTRKWI